MSSKQILGILTGLLYRDWGGGGSTFDALKIRVVIRLFTFQACKHSISLVKGLIPEDMILP